MKTNSLIAAAAVLAIGALSASAQIWVSGLGDGTQASGDTAIGYEFNAASTFSITQLGAFTTTGTLNGTAQVRVWQDTGSGYSLVGGADAKGGALSGNYLWVAAPPSLSGLASGHYILSVWYDPLGGDLHGDTGAGNTPPSFNSIPGITLATVISPNSTLIASTVGDLRPDSAYVNGIKGPNMSLAVPEPETYALIAGLGLLGFGLYRRNQVRG